MFTLIPPVILGLVGTVSLIVFAVLRTRVMLPYASSVRRSPKTTALVYFFIPIVLSFLVIPAFLSDLFWRTLGTGIPLTLVIMLSAGLGYLLVGLMKKTSMFAEVSGRDRPQCCLALFIAILIYPSVLVVFLNNVSLQAPAYFRTAVVTKKMDKGDKYGNVQDFLAFKGDQVIESGGVEVSPVLYKSIERGSKVIVCLKNGWLGFPVVVGIAKG